MTSEKPRHLSGIPETPNNLLLKEALKETLAKAQGIELYLTGGTAAAVYAGETRPLSLDLDFFVDPDSKEKITNRFGGQFRYFGEKKLFKSEKLVAASSSGVDLDFIAEQNIVPDENDPEQKITVRLTKFAKSKACESEFMGERVQVLPPEMIVIAKLFAGRGRDLNKYDLDDSEAVIESGIMRQDFIRRAVAEIAGKDEKIRNLVQSRLLAALTKLKSSDRVNEVMRTVADLESSWDIESITESVRRRSIPG